jgi:8-oxo-dGTP diphosphatase
VNYEELDIITDIKSLFHSYPSIPDFELTMHSFICTATSKELILYEHIAQEWLPISELKKLDWAAADIPIVNKIMNG